MAVFARGWGKTKGISAKCRDIHLKVSLISSTVLCARNYEITKPIYIDDIFQRLAEIQDSGDKLAQTSSLVRVREDGAEARFVDIYTSVSGHNQLFYFHLDVDSPSSARVTLRSWRTSWHVKRGRDCQIPHLEWLGVSKFTLFSVGPISIARETVRSTLPSAISVKTFRKTLAGSGED